MADDYQKWLQENGVETTDENGAPAGSLIPWWVWVLFSGAAIKGIKVLIASFT